MNYSKSHQLFAEYLENPKALTNPQEFLGQNYETVLNFWKWMDSLNQDQWSIVADRYRNLDPAARNVALYTAWPAVRDAARDAALDAAWEAARDAAGGAAGYAAASATYELMGMHLLLEQGKKLVFVPMFDGL